MTTAILHPHSHSQRSGIQAFSARLTRASEDRLLVEYRIEGDIGRLLIPAGGAGTRRNGLWQHTCCEIFVQVDASPAYYEFNFSPAGDWAAYRFDGYRSGMVDADLAAPPAIVISQSASELQLEAAITLPDELSSAGAAPLSLTAVIEDRDERITYWAAAHAPAKPDFHHDAGFVLRLPTTQRGRTEGVS